MKRTRRTMQIGRLGLWNFRGKFESLSKIIKGYVGNILELETEASKPLLDWDINAVLGRTEKSAMTNKRPASQVRSVHRKVFAQG